MNYLLPALTAAAALTLGSCGLLFGTSPVAFQATGHPDIRLELSRLPDDLKNEEFGRGLIEDAALVQGPLRSFGRIDTEKDYRYDRLDSPLRAGEGDVLRVTVDDSSQPLLAYVRTADGDLAGVGGIPAAADHESPGRVIFELPLPPDSTLDGIGFVSPLAAEWNSDNAPRLELGPGTGELIMTADLFQLPAGLRLEIDGNDLLLDNLSALALSTPSRDSADRSYIELAYRNSVDLPSGDGLPRPETVQAELGMPDGSSRSRTVRLRQGEVGLYFHPGNLGTLPDTIRLAGLPDGFSLQRAAAATLSAADETPEPLPIDLGSLYSYDRSHWRNEGYELFQWSLFPRVLYFDFADYATQARFFRRLAFFVEKDGYQGSLLGDDDLRHRHGYNAHNYNGAGLADFFTAADNEGFDLREEEELLRAIALEAGIITGSRGSYRQGSGGVLSISRESPFGTGMRNLLMSHEAMHGVFYEQKEFFDYVWNIWERELTPQQREFWRLFMRSVDYSPDDDYLMVNELQAYLLQYPHSNNDWYYNSLVRERMLGRYPQRREFINQFYRENPDFFTDLSRKLNRILYRTTGLVGGDVRDIISD